MQEPLNLLSHVTGLCTVSQHCHRLSEAMAVLEHGWPWGGSNWLRMGSSLTGIEVNLTQFDESLSWCSGADEFVMAEEASAKALIFELARFSFIWGGLEATLDAIGLP